MTHDVALDLMGYFAVTMMGLLALANILVITGKAAHYDKLVKQFINQTSQFAWVFRLGGGNHEVGRTTAWRRSHPTQ